MEILNKGEIKTLSDKRKLRLFIARIPAVHEMSRDFFFGLMGNNPETWMFGRERRTNT